MARSSQPTFLLKTFIGMKASTYINDSNLCKCPISDSQTPEETDHRILESTPIDQMERFKNRHQ